MKIVECESASVPDYESTVRKAQATDRAALGNADAEEIKRARTQLLDGGVELDDTGLTSAHDMAIKEILEQFQGWFKNYIIRRTIWSKDPDGKPIWAAEDPQEVLITLNLSQHELEVIEKQAETLMKDRTLGWQKVRNFCRCRASSDAVRPVSST